MPLFLHTEVKLDFVPVENKKALTATILESVKAIQPDDYRLINIDLVNLPFETVQKYLLDYDLFKELVHKAKKDLKQSSDSQVLSQTGKA